MSLYRILNATAQQLDDAALLLEKTAKAFVGSKETVGRAQLVALAKTAADKLLQAGLISNAQKRDAFVNEVLSHEKALAKLAKLADLVTPQKIGKVAKSAGSESTTTADDVWARHVMSAMSRLGQR